MGFEYYLTKPMNVLEVMNTIKSILDRDKVIR
ncbi:MAG: DNA-binding response OmpR family regulator [Alteromonadaceae bacterium]|jgi:DNA-binding response OmpR family regulator